MDGEQARLSANRFATSEHRRTLPCRKKWYEQTRDFARRPNRRRKIIICRCDSTLNDERPICFRKMKRTKDFTGRFDGKGNTIALRCGSAQVTPNILFDLIGLLAVHIWYTQH